MRAANEASKHQKANAITSPRVGESWVPRATTCFHVRETTARVIHHVPLHTACCNVQITLTPRPQRYHGGPNALRHHPTPGDIAGLGPRATYEIVTPPATHHGPPRATTRVVNAP